MTEQNTDNESKEVTVQDHLDTLELNRQIEADRMINALFFGDE